MHTHRCVLIEISMEIGMLNFWLGLLVTAKLKETYFSFEENHNFSNKNAHLCAWRKIGNIYFTICTWPNGPVRANILLRFQFEGKTDVWISQVRRVNQIHFFIVLRISKLKIFEKATKTDEIVLFCSLKSVSNTKFL